MSELVDAVRALGVPFETSDTGSWVRFTCEEGVPRYIVRARLADGYLTWGASGDESTLEWYLRPTEAIRRQRQVLPPPWGAEPARPAAASEGDSLTEGRDDVYLPFTSGNSHRNPAPLS